MHLNEIKCTQVWFIIWGARPHILKQNMKRQKTTLNYVLWLNYSPVNRMSILSPKAHPKHLFSLSWSVKSCVEHYISDPTLATQFCSTGHAPQKDILQEPRNTGLKEGRLWGSSRKAEARLLTTQHRSEADSTGTSKLRITVQSTECSQGWKPVTTPHQHTQT